MNSINSNAKMTSLHISTTFFIILIFSLVSLVFFTTPVNDNAKGFAGFEADGLAYGAMAGAHIPVLKPQGAPWCYRILTPFLVSLLPWSILQNFIFLAFVSNVLSLFILLHILKRYRFSDELCLIGLLLYSGVFWALKFSFYSPAYIDFQTQLFLLLIIFLTTTQRYLMLIPVLIISALQKESLAAYSLYSVVHFLTCHYRQLNKRLVFHAVSMVVFPFVTVLLVRYLVFSDNNYSPTVILFWMSRMADIHFWPKFIQSVFSGLGLLTALLILQYGPWVKFLKSNIEWIVYLCISALFLFGGIDKARLFMYMLPLFVILSLKVIQEFKRMVSSSTFYLWASLMLLIHWFIGGNLSPMGSHSFYLAKMVPFHAGWSFLPYLFRNLTLAVLFVVCTIWFAIGEWYFHPTTGFTRRVISHGNNNRD